MLRIFSARSKKLSHKKHRLSTVKAAFLPVRGSTSCLEQPFLDYCAKRTAKTTLI